MSFAHTLYKVLAAFLGYVDYVLGLLTSCPKFHGPHSLEVEGKQPDGETLPRRMPNMIGKNMEVCCLPGEWKTMAEMCIYVVQRRRYARAFAWRPVLGQKERAVGVTKPGEKPRTVTVTVLGPTQHLTFRQFGEKVLAVSAGLRALGMKAGDVLAVFEDTRYEWMLIAHGAWQQSITIATVYANLGEEALAFALNQTEAKVVFTNARNVKRLMHATNLPHLTTIIYTDTLAEVPVVEAKQAISIAEVEALGKRTPVLSVMPQPTDLACIMYTSGTTGDPKGVMLTHRNVVAAVASKFARIRVFMGRDDLWDLGYMAYLPLAHILELVAEHVWFSGGGLLAYGTPRTLTDNTAEPHGDLSEFRPALCVGVPRVYDTIKKAIEAQLASKPELVRILFATAFAQRREAIAKGRDTPLWNLLVFRKFAAIFGGRLRVLISGGAPLNPTVHEFMRILLGCAVVQGYGLTETCACLSLQHYGDDASDSVGGIQQVCEVKLVDIPDMGYTSRDLPCPRGEIVLRGPAVAKGYFKMPEKTQEDFSEDGWFPTGDVGMWMPDGSLRIIDRKKNLVKLAMGEYVALERLESVYGNIPYILPNGICVVADPAQSYVVALILVQKEAVLRMAREHGWALDLQGLLGAPAVRQVVQQALNAEAKRAGLKPFEHIKKFRLYDDEWTAENGMLTAAMKLLRRNIQAHYAKDVAALYAEP